MPSFDQLCQHLHAIVQDQLDAAIRNSSQHNITPAMAYQYTLSSLKTLFFDDQPGAVTYGNQTMDPALLRQASSCPYIRVKPHENYVPAFSHRHDFIELNYVLTGSCCQTIGGKPYLLRAGDLLLMDMQTEHTVEPMDAQSILINILLLPQQAEEFLQAILPEDSALNTFVFQSAHRLAPQANYLLFHMAERAAFQDIMFHFLCECYFPRDRRDTTLLVSYLRVLFALLSQELTLSPQGVDCVYPPDSKIGPIVNYIRTHCRDCTRSSTAQTFGYTKTYISMLLKEHTGQSFLALRNGFRLAAIRSTLQMAPDTPIHALIEEYGFTNSTYFFRLYKETYGATPKQDAAQRSSK